MKRLAVCIAIAACVPTWAIGAVTFTTTLSETQVPGFPGAFFVTDTATFSEDPLVGALHWIWEDPHGNVLQTEGITTSSGTLEYTSQPFTITPSTEQGVWSVFATFLPVNGIFQIEGTPNPEQFTVGAVPEPATLALVGIALVGVGFARRHDRALD